MLLVVLASVLLCGGIGAPVLVVLVCHCHMSHQLVRAVHILLVWQHLVQFFEVEMCWARLVCLLLTVSNMSWALQVSSIVCLFGQP